MTVRAAAALAKGMASELQLEIGDAERIVLQYAPVAVRSRLASFFALDRRLGQIVAGTNEPMLGQMRLAWWRDQLKASVGDRPSGDVVLDAIGEGWGGAADALQPLVDAWEAFLVAEELTDYLIIGFARDRSSPIVSAMKLSSDRDIQPATEAGTLWALADTAAHVSDEGERTRILNLAQSRMETASLHARLPAAFAVLRALSRRAIERGGRPLMEGRGAAFTALRAGLIGR